MSPPRATRRGPRMALAAGWVGLTFAGIALSVQPASAAVSYHNVADTTTSAPGHGSFTGFGIFPSVSGSNVAFQGGYSGGSGIYTGSVGATGAAKVVDTGDTAPGHGAFTEFSFSSVSGSNVAFWGNYGDGQGIYTGSVGATGAAKIVDTGDTAPGHGAFIAFHFTPSVSGSNVAFRGFYSGGRGIYTGSVGATGAAKVVDFTDTAPGHGPFTDFGDSPSVSGSNAYLHSGSRGEIAVIAAALDGPSMKRI